MWASLPCDLLVEILRRLETTAVFRCAGTCKPWRRAIIANASCLHPRPDRFNPNLLIGFFYKSGWYGSYQTRLQYVPGRFQDMDGSAPLAAAGVDVKQYNQLLSSRDGLLLLGGGGSETSKVSDLCLCNPLAGSCRFLPAAAFGAQETMCTYVLVTAGDDSAVAWVLALRREGNITNSVVYQVFSSSSGEWGPVKESAMFESGILMADRGGNNIDAVVCCGSIVYCLVWLCLGGRPSSFRSCVFAMDVHTERTWTMEVPDKYAAAIIWNNYSIVLATSEDGRLSVISQMVDQQIEMWVFGGGEWTLRRTIDLHKVGNVRMIIRGFCPKSGCLFGDAHNDDVLVDVNTGSLRLTGRIRDGRVTMYPYEMDWSTYISKMKYF